MIDDLSFFLDFTVDFKLIAIRSKVESHKLCYFINKVTGSELGRMNEDVDFYISENKTTVYYPVYQWKSKLISKNWYLIQNVISEEFVVEYDEVSEPLFTGVNDKLIKKLYLINSLDGVQFFLQIYPPTTNIEVEEIANKIDDLPFVDRAFVIDPNKIDEIQNILIH